MIIELCVECYAAEMNISVVLSFVAERNKLLTEVTILTNIQHCLLDMYTTDLFTHHTV